MSRCLQIHFPILSHDYRRIDDATRVAFVAALMPTLSFLRLSLAVVAFVAQFSQSLLFYRLYLHHHREKIFECW